MRHLGIELADDGALERARAAAAVRPPLLGEAGQRADEQLDAEGRRGAADHLGGLVAHHPEVVPHALGQEDRLAGAVLALVAADGGPGAAGDDGEVLVLAGVAVDAPPVSAPRTVATNRSPVTGL